MEIKEYRKIAGLTQKRSSEGFEILIRVVKIGAVGGEGHFKYSMIGSSDGDERICKRWRDGYG